MGALGGTLYVVINGAQAWAEGDWEYHLGLPKREAKIGTNGALGFTEEPMAAYCKGQISDHSGFALQDLLTLEAATVTLELANGKTIVFSNAWYSGEGTVNAKTGTIDAQFHALTAEEIGG